MLVGSKQNENILFVTTNSYLRNIYAQTTSKTCHRHLNFLAYYSAGYTNLSTGFSAGDFNRYNRLRDWHDHIIYRIRQLAKAQSRRAHQRPVFIDLLGLSLTLGMATGRLRAGGKA